MSQNEGNEKWASSKAMENFGFYLKKKFPLVCHMKVEVSIPEDVVAALIVRLGISGKSQEPLTLWLNLYFAEGSLSVGKESNWSYRDLPIIDGTEPELLPTLEYLIDTLQLSMAEEQDRLTNLQTVQIWESRIFPWQLG